MNLGEMFDGKLHFMEPDEDWSPPNLKLLEDGIVALEVQHRRDESIESPEVGIAPTAVAESEEAYWGVQRGWAAFSVMAQAMAEMLGGKSLAVQSNHRSEEDSLAFAPTVGVDAEGYACDPEDVEVEYTFKFVPGRHGWQGGML